MPPETYGPLSLLPPLVAISLAIATRRIVISLLLGVAAGALLLTRGDLPAAAVSLVADHLWPSLADRNHLQVFAFTLAMGAMVGVIHRSGGMHSVVQAMAPLARGRRSGQLTTWLLGLFLFFDDYANTLLLGTTLRPLADRLRISREKLAYLVDSTAAPVAGLAVVSTWVAGEIGYIQSGFEELGAGWPEVDGFGILIATLPYRFYVIWALAIIPLIALLDRDFGPMWVAERAAAGPAGDRRAPRSPASHGDGSPRGWHNAALPIAVLLAVTVGVQVVSGGAGAGAPPRGWLASFARGDSYTSLLAGSLAGLAVGFLWIRWQGAVAWAELFSAAVRGAGQMSLALIILWLAWALSGVTDREHLGAGAYVGGLLEQVASSVWLPTLVFLLASFVAFATGTSWGTMGILMPLVISATHRVLVHETGGMSPHDPILLASIGSVLAGAIFGDHCSPISDTTVLSSQASGCSHMAHVRTQMPYALLVAGAAIVFGTLPVGFGISPWWLLPTGVAALAAVVRFFGRPVS